MSFFFSVLSFLQIGEREREREREGGWYIKFGYKRRNSPKVTYLIFRRGSTGESFFFHGLIDFMLFLTLAWRIWVPRVQDMFLSSSPGVMAMGLSARAPSNNWPFYFLFPPTGRSPHIRFRVSANHLASPPFPLVSGDLRLLSTQHLLISPLWPTFFLKRSLFWRVCHCSYPTWGYY